MEVLENAKKLQRQMVKTRRELHKNAETGFQLDKTLKIVERELLDIGIRPTRCGKAALVATIGKGKRTIMLRADMDALPMKEQSGETFSSKTNSAHTCGHDLHTAMLLGAARLLKEKEESLNGRVKLLFQAAEEILEGAKDTIENGVLKSPKVDAALMLHVLPAVDLKSGTLVVSSPGVSAPASDFFTIEIQGKGCHGSAPWNGVDALTVASHIIIALQEIIARETPIADPAVLTVGKLEMDGAGNAIADFVSLHGTLRCFDENRRKMLKNRLEEVANSIANAFRASVKIIYGGSCPTLLNDEELSVFCNKKLKDLFGEKGVLSSNELYGDVKKKSGGSEDFAYFSQEVPSVMIGLAAGERKDGYEYPLHHPKVCFDEGVLTTGCAAFAYLACEWLKKE